MTARSRQVARKVLLVLAGDVIAGLLFFAANGSTAAANGMRCDNRLVQPGDSTYDVKTLCGPPDDAQQRTEQRRVRHAVTRECAAPGGRCSVLVEEVIDIVIDEWTYDFGPQRFLQYLTFEQGKLVLVRSGGYGHKQR